MNDVIVGQYAEYDNLWLQLRATPTGRYAADVFDGERPVATSGGEHAMEEEVAKERALQLVATYRRKPGTKIDARIEWKPLRASQKRDLVFDAKK